MSTYIPGTSVRQIGLGNHVLKSYDLVVETADLFNVTGIVLVTSLVGYVSTAITVANTVKLTANPTTGTSLDLCAATDIGTTDTPAGDLLTLPNLRGGSLVRTIGTAQLGQASGTVSTGDGTVTGDGGPFYLTAGVLQQVTATGADGTIAWHLCYVPISDDGVVEAA